MYFLNIDFKMVFYTDIFSRFLIFAVLIEICFQNLMFTLIKHLRRWEIFAYIDGQIDRYM